MAPPYPWQPIACRISGADASLPAATPYSCSGLSTGQPYPPPPGKQLSRHSLSRQQTQGLRSKVAAKTFRRRCAAAKLSGKDGDGRGTATEGTIPLATSCYKKA
jgi:hypothetical protein